MSGSDYWTKCLQCGKRFIEGMPGTTSVSCSYKCTKAAKDANRDETKAKEISRRIHKSRKQEAEIAQQIGGRRVVGSGCLPGVKGDSISPDLLVEAKFTEAEQYRLTQTEWRKVAISAAINQRTPVMQIDIQGTKLAVLAWDYFLELQGVDE